MKKIGIAIFLAALFAGTAFCQDPAQDLPAGTKWVLHLDLDRARLTSLAEFVMDVIDERAGKEKLEQALAVLSITPEEAASLQTIGSLTLCGPDNERDNALIYIRGRLEKSMLEKLVLTMDEHATDMHEGHVIHGWKPKPRPHGRHGRHGRHGKHLGRGKGRHKGPPARVFASYVDQGVLVMGANRERVIEALGVIDGKAQALQDPKLLTMLASPGEAFFLFAAADVGDTESFEPRTAVGEKINTASFKLGEENGLVKGLASVEAKTEEAAGQLGDIARGWRALAKLMGSRRAVPAAAAESLQISTAGRQIDATFSVPVSVVIENARKRMAEHKGETGQPAIEMETNEGDGQ